MPWLAFELGVVHRLSTAHRVQGPAMTCSESAQPRPFAARLRTVLRDDLTSIPINPQRREPGTECLRGPFVGIFVVKLLSTRRVLANAT